MGRLSLVALLVRDYDEAIDWFSRALGLRLTADQGLGGDKRWVVIEDEAGRALLLARAVGSRELAAVGNQHGGRVGFFLEVTDFEASLGRLKEAGALLEEEPRAEPYGRVVVFRDLYGNRWDLIEPAGT